MNISQAGNCILKQFNKAQARLSSEAGEGLPLIINYFYKFLHLLHNYQHVSSLA